MHYCWTVWLHWKVSIRRIGSVGWRHIEVAICDCNKA